MAADGRPATHCRTSNQELPETALSSFDLPHVVAQLAEPPTVNRVVAGSRPADAVIPSPR